MPDFSFKAYAKDGSLVADRLTAATRADAVRQITTRGLAPFEVKEGVVRRAVTRSRVPYVDVTLPSKDEIPDL